MMIPRETVNLYRSIQAPASLEETVRMKMQSAVPATPAKKKHQSWKPMLAAAACVAVVLLAGVTGKSGTKLTMNGTTVGAAPVAVSAPAAPRAIALAAAEPLVLELSLNQEIGQTQAQVSHGEIVLDDPVNGATTLQWIITDPEVSEDATLTLNIKNQKTQYLLHADAQGVWYMEKTK